MQEPVYLSLVWSIGSHRRNSKMREGFNLNGPVSGWVTSWEAPSGESLNHAIVNFQAGFLFIYFWFLMSLLVCVIGVASWNGFFLISLQRPYVCTVDDCQSSYRRKDHLTRHLLQHKGKLFKCPIESCNREFSIQGNITRHVKELHDEDHPSSSKQYVCPEVGCGKVFRFASNLRQHEDSHGKLIQNFLTDNCFL